MEVWRDGQVTVSFDLLGVGEREAGKGWQCPVSGLWAFIHAVRPRKKILGEVSLSGSRFSPPFTVKLEQSWENGAGVN